MYKRFSITTIGACTCVLGTGLEVFPGVNYKMKCIPPLQTCGWKWFIYDKSTWYNAVVYLASLFIFFNIQKYTDGGPGWL